MSIWVLQASPSIWVPEDRPHIYLSPKMFHELENGKGIFFEKDKIQFDFRFNMEWYSMERETRPNKTRFVIEDE